MPYGRLVSATFSGLCCRASRASKPSLRNLRRYWGIYFRLTDASLEQSSASYLPARHRGPARGDGEMNDTDRLWHPGSASTASYACWVRGAVTTGQGGVPEGARAEKSDPTRGLVN